MSDEQLVWALDLDVKKDSALEGANALEQLKEAILGDTVALREMQGALRNLKGSALASDETIKGLKDRISASKATIAGNTLELVKNKGAFEKQPKPVDKIAEAIKKMDAANKHSADVMRLQMAPALERNKRNIEALGPKLGGFVNGLSDLRGMLSAGAIFAGLTAVAAGMVLVAGAAVGATLSLLGYTIAQADARRSDMLRLEGLSKFRNYWQEMVTGQRRAADSASYLQSTIDGVAAGSALSRDRIGEMTSELYHAGLRGSRLKDALEGLAIVESTQGKESAAQFKARAMGAAIYGTSIKALANDVKTRLGGVARAQMLSLDVQQRKMHESIAHLFDGIKIEKFLEGLSKITELFSQNTAIGRALKVLLETIFQPMIDGVATTGPIVKKFFQGVVIGALYMTIAILKVRNYIRDTFGGADTLKGFNLMNAALGLGIFAFGMLATAVLVCTGFVAALLAVGAALATPFILAGVWVAKFFDAVVSAAKGIGKVDWTETGSMITRGIAAGITLGGSEVILAIGKLGSDSIVAFKNKLKIKSPSQVFKHEASQVPAGIVEAHEAGRAKVRNSASRLASAAVEGFNGGEAPIPSIATRGGSGGGASGTSGRPSVSITIEQLTIGAGQSAAQIKDSLREAVEEIFERTAHSMGASV